MRRRKLSPRRGAPFQADKAIVGLGNPGRRYAKTRHNAGFMAVDRLAKRHSARLSKSAHGGKKCEIPLQGIGVVLFKPATFMNEGGRSVDRLLRDRGLELDQLLVVVDDMALDLGLLRMREKGGAGGHNGIASVIHELGSDRFARLRIGIGAPPGPEWRDFVLSSFAPDEYDTLTAALEEACEACEMWIHQGAKRTMDAFNRKQVSHDRPCA